MTEQEAEVLMVRVARIWAGTEQKTWVRELALPSSLLVEAFWHFNAKTQFFYASTQMRDGIFVCMAKLPARQYVHFQLVCKEKRSPKYNLLMRCEIQAGTMYSTDQNEFNQIVQGWLPFFRRGCWLSGCAIEASAHEKAEWVQGFSHEEIEAWNLKI